MITINVSFMCFIYIGIVLLCVACSLVRKLLLNIVNIICIFLSIEQNNQTSKSATIEMYAPSSYNDTVTGETLSSVSEKSETYSNEGSNNDYVVSSFCLFH